MSYPDKLLVSGITTPSNANGEYLPSDFVNGVPTYRFGNFAFAPIFSGQVVDRWLFRYVVEPDLIAGQAEIMGFTAETLTGPYELQQPDAFFVLGAPIFNIVFGVPEDFNGTYLPGPVVDGRTSYVHTADAGHSIRWISLTFQYGIFFNGSVLVYKKPGLGDPDLDSPHGYSYQTNGVANSSPAPFVVGNSYFFAGLPIVEAVTTSQPEPLPVADLLPANSTPQEKALSLATSRVGSVAVEGRTLWSPQTCPAGLLPWLGWALSVDEWNTDWTEQQKRDAIAASIAIHRKKGTLGALRRALSVMGYEVIINEATGEAYTFRIAIKIADVGIADNSVFEQAERITNRAKNARSHLLGIDAYGEVSGRSVILTGSMSGETSRVWPLIVEELVSDQPAFRINVGSVAGDIATVFPN